MDFRKDYAMAHVEAATERHLYYQLTKKDLTPGRPWSVEIKDKGEYLLALQDVEYDALDRPDVGPFWWYLHCHRLTI